MTDPAAEFVTRTDTLLAHAGGDPFQRLGFVNPPVYHASTVLFPSLDALEAADAAPFTHYNYGRIGTPTTQSFEGAVAELEGAPGAVVASSGLNAIAIALTAFTRAGDHVLITDSAYGPTRRFCNEVLSRYGVQVEYYDPLIGSGIRALMRPETRVVYLEAPGSLTFEMQDIPAIAEIAHASGATVLMDNTWATPLYFRALDHGVDVSIHAATKYLVGHSDAMLGVIGCRRECWEPVKRAAVRFGTCAGPDDIALGLRGLRTLSVRLERHFRNALRIAEWLEGRPEVTRVLYPALPSDPGHALWRRDFRGASGLLAFELRPAPRSALAALVDGMELFRLGYSWGGFESLLLPAHPEKVRSATRWQAAGPLLRLHVGLEDPADLIADLERGFARLATAP